MSQPAQSWFRDTVSALVYALAGLRREPGHPELEPPYNDLTQFVLRQQAQMPDYLRRPMVAATLGFDLFGLGWTAGRFHVQALPARQKQIASWKASKLGFQRDLIRYYESLATLALFSRDADTRAPTHPLPGGEGWGEGGRDRQEPTGPKDAKACLDNPQILQAPPRDLRAQMVVIGSGPGGAITAALLAEAGREVLLVEEGPSYRLESCLPFSKEEMLQKYRNGGQTVALGKNKIAYVEGRCVGGGSEINSGLYHRTPPDILERWRKEFAVEALSEADLRPHFEVCERDVSVSLMPGAAPAASLKLHEGGTKLGWKSMEVPRWFRYSGSGASGTRQSMTETFVPRFVQARGKLLPNTRILKLRQEAGKWLLTARHDVVGAVRIEAETLFVCGGAVQTPALLRRSGITRNIGNSLRLHPTVKVVAKFAEAVNAADMGVPVHQVKEFAPRLSFGCSISTPAYLALGLLDHPEASGEVSAAWRQMANYYAMITGEGRGTVRPLPGFHDPLVRYQITENDRRDLAAGFRKLSEALFAAGAVALYPSLSGGAALRATDDLRKLPQVLPNSLASLMTIHLFCSCPMGEDKTRCATDSFGRVHGFESLFVADGSLLCTAPGVNPQGTIMALARRNALRFLGTH